jgi:hypothetical protein
MAIRAHVVNCADDFVICCRPRNAGAAMTRMTALMTRLGVEVNVTKARIARLPDESFDFHGYTAGRFDGKDALTIGSRVRSGAQDMKAGGIRAYYRFR